MSILSRRIKCACPCCNGGCCFRQHHGLKEIEPIIGIYCDFDLDEDEEDEASHQEQ